MIGSEFDSNGIPEFTLRFVKTLLEVSVSPDGSGTLAPLLDQKSKFIRRIPDRGRCDHIGAAKG
jgi:hypothetical protein